MGRISNAKLVAFIKAVATDYNFLKAEIAKLAGKGEGVTEQRVVEIINSTNASSGVASNETIKAIDARVQALETELEVDYVAVYEAAKNGTNLDTEGQPVGG